MQKEAPNMTMARPRTPILRRIGLIALTGIALLVGIGSENIALPLGIILSSSPIVVGLAGVISGFGVTAALSWLAAKVGHLRHRRRFALISGGALALALVLAALFLNLAQPLLLPATPESDVSAVVAGLRRYAVPLASTEPGAPDSDLEAFGRAVAGKRVVALGEATHGTHEIFTVKERLIAYLVTAQGFRQIAIETSAQTGDAMNTYIQGGSVDIRSYLSFPDATAEFLHLLTWLRQYNGAASDGQRVTITGMDPVGGNRDAGMAANVLRQLDVAGPASRIIVWAHNQHIANIPGALGSRLVARLGAAQVYLLGFEFDAGGFTSDAGLFGVVRTYSVGRVPREYYAWTLAQVGAPNLFLDFATVGQDPAVRHWLGLRQYTHDIGSQYGISQLTPMGRLDDDIWLHVYNGVIFIAQSTPAQALGQ